MAREKSIFVCSDCGASASRWAGQCPQCRAWNTIREEIPPPPGPPGERRAGYAGTVAEVRTMDAVEAETVSRLPTGLGEFDRVLGGGLVPGSVVLVGGDPGVGKSTALLQVCCTLSENVSTLYVTGEESLQQIALRAKRLGLQGRDLLLAAETRVEDILATAEARKPQVIVIDSIQTMEVAELSSAPGSVSQVREAAAMLTRFAKQSGTAILLVGHVTKSGDLAGPRVLEHIIDVVCYFEGESGSRFRVMRAVKNRYGAVNELGVFAMTERGLKEIKNPSAIFLSRHDESLPGSVVTVLWEGSRPLLVELQALTDDSYAENPRRVTLGVEQNRLIMLLAVLNRHGGLSSSGRDVFVNVVGGVRVTETSADLALILSVASSLRNRAIPRELIAFGEIGLAGEIRPVPSGEERIREAARHGFKRALVPAANKPREAIAGIEVIALDRLDRALEVLTG